MIKKWGIFINLVSVYRDLIYDRVLWCKVSGIDASDTCVGNNNAFFFTFLL